jgi:hypothetical protein
MKSCLELLADIEAAKQLQIFTDHFESYQDVCTEKEKIHVSCNLGPVARLCDFVEKTKDDVHFWNAFGMCKEDFMIKVSSIVARFSSAARNELFSPDACLTPFHRYVTAWAQELWHRTRQDLPTGQERQLPTVPSTSEYLPRSQG